MEIRDGKVYGPCGRECAICPDRNHCASLAHYQNKINGVKEERRAPASHGGNCPGTQTLNTERTQSLTLERTKTRPLLTLEWNSEQVKLTRERLESTCYDPAGRLFSFSTQRSIWRRGLDGRLLRISHNESYAKDLPACHFHEGHEVTFEESQKWTAWAQDFLQKALEHFGDHPALRLARSFDPEQDSQRFRKIWRHVGILPPDQYKSLVLQLTHGCSYNKCTFCGFFKDAKFSVKTPEEFTEHVNQALDFFGLGLNGRRDIFIGQANALSADTESLLSALQIIRKALSEHPQTRDMDRHRFARVNSFLDTFSVKRSVKEWAQLRAAGLDCVYLGVESGSQKVLHFLQKPGTAEHTIKLIKDLKEAGLSVGPIVMTGVGGVEMAGEHIQATADMLNALPLDSRDRVYISEFLEVPGSKYQAVAKEKGLTPFGRLECRMESRRLRNKLNFPLPPHGPMITLYDVRQFIY